LVGGGIFSVLGVVVSVAGGWAWLSFVVAGLIALATAFSYVALADELGEGGRAFSFLRAFDHEGLAASLSWLLIVGYVLNMSVYAFTFGHYLGQVLRLPSLVVRVAAVSIVAALVVVNLRGVSDSARLEIFVVWAKLAVLVGLAAIGLVALRRGQPERRRPDRRRRGRHPQGCGPSQMQNRCQSAPRYPHVKWDYSMATSSIGGDHRRS
jgi:amino acid transporter